MDSLRVSPSHWVLRLRLLACGGCGFTWQEGPQQHITATTTATTAPSTYPYSFEAEVMMAAMRSPHAAAARCPPVQCHELRSSLPAGVAPVQLVQTLLPGRKLANLGFRRLQVQLELANFASLGGAQQHQLLADLGVLEYVGNGVSGVVPFFCDGSGPSCHACKALPASRGLISRASRKGERLEQLCSTTTNQALHTSFGKQSLASMTAAELMYKVCGAEDRVSKTCMCLASWAVIHACASG